MATPDPSFFDEIDEDAEAAADAKGLAHLDEGEGIAHAEVAEWLDTWGTLDEKPAPASWRKQSGRPRRSPILRPSEPISA